MVNGLDTFRRYFEKYNGDYVLIGGVACELALKSLQLDFRPTIFRFLEPKDDSFPYKLELASDKPN